MSFWNSIVDVLRSPAFRIGSGIAGVASGAGAFEGLGDWGQALSGLTGAANLASGAATAFGPGRSDLDKVTGGLQLGLGGYNLGQGLGAVDSFGNIFDSLSGSGTANTSPAITGPADQGSGAISGYPGYDTSVTSTPLAPFAGQPTDPATQSPFNGQAYPITGTVSADMPGYRGALSDATTDLGTGDRAQLTPADVPNAWTPQVPPPSMPGGGAPTPVPSQAPDTALPPTADPNATPHPVPHTTVAPTTTPAGTPPAAAATPGPSMTASIINPGGALASSGATPDRGNFFDRVWTSLATTAENNPIGAAMTALSIGAMISQQFASSRSDIAQQALDQLRASQPPPPAAPGAPTPPPPMPDSAEFRKLFEDKAKIEIDRMYNEARSSLTARMGSRGMLNSTVYTNALESLDKARIDSTATLPASSLAAWNQALGEWTRAAAVINQTNQTNNQSTDAYNRSLLAYADQQSKDLQAVTSYVNAAVPQTNFADMTRVLAQSPFIQSLAARQPA